MRRNLVTLIACIVAIVSASQTITTKQEAKRLINNAEKEAALKYEPTIEKLSERNRLLQAFVNERGLYYEQPCPDDGLVIKGVYPQLIYDRDMK